MVRSNHLDLADARGAALPNTFLRQEERADTLALLFPGRGYRATMPLLYYSQLALLERGADVLRLDLAYDLDPRFGDAPAEEQRTWIRHDALVAFAAGLAQGSYRHLILVGKSLGTWALTDILQDHVPPPELACVWLTPLLHDEALVRAVRERRPPSLFVIGTADPLYDATLLSDLSALPDSQNVIVPEADHGLTVPGDVRTTLEGLARYVEALITFLDTAIGTG